MNLRSLIFLIRMSIKELEAIRVTQIELESGAAVTNGDFK